MKAISSQINQIMKIKYYYTILYNVLYFYTVRRVGIKVLKLSYIWQYNERRKVLKKQVDETPKNDIMFKEIFSDEEILRR